MRNPHDFFGMMGVAHVPVALALGFGWKLRFSGSDVSYLGFCGDGGMICNDDWGWLSQSWSSPSPLQAWVGCLHMHSYMSVDCMYVHIYIHTCNPRHGVHKLRHRQAACYIYMYIYMFMWLCVYISIYIYIYVYEHSWAQTHAGKFAVTQHSLQAWNSHFRGLRSQRRLLLQNWCC